MPSYDPAVVTHIVVADVKGPFKQRLGIKRYSDIPNHIPTVKWDWVLSGLKYRPVKRKKAPAAEGSASAAASTSNSVPGDEYEYEYRMDGEWEHAAFPQRIDAGKTPWGELPPKQPAPAPASVRASAPGGSPPPARHEPNHGGRSPAAGPITHGGGSDDDMSSSIS